MEALQLSHFDPDVQAVLQRLLRDVRAVLGEQFVGLYVHGSLAYGDYDASRSDMDVLVVTVQPLPQTLVAALQVMHERITLSGMPRATNMEVSYIPRSALRRFDRADCHHPALRADGTFGVDGHGHEWVIQRHIIREHGITLAGPDPRTMIDPVCAEDLRQSVRGLLEEWWAPQLHDPFRLRSDEYQAYAILTMCRMLYTLTHGSIASKPQAGSWAQAALDQRWAALIVRALAWRHGDGMDAFDDALAMIAFTLQENSRFAAKDGKSEHGQPC